MSRACRGIVLLHTLIIVAVMAFMASVVMRWAFARHIIAKRNMDSSISTGVVEGVYAKVFACLQGTDVGVNTCTPPGAAISCMPTQAEASQGSLRDVRICIGGSPPQCEIRVKFNSDPNEGPGTCPGGFTSIP